MKEFSGGAHGSYTVQTDGGHLDLPSRLDVFDFLKKAEIKSEQLRSLVRKHNESVPKGGLGTVDEAGDIQAALIKAQQLSSLVRKHKESVPKGGVGAIDKAGDIQAALMGLSPVLDRVPRMVADNCTFYKSATAEVLAMETAYLADTPVLQHIYTATMAQVAKERDENMRKLLEEESQQQQAAATKSSKRSRKARGGKAVKAKNIEACDKVQSNQKETHSADDISMVDSGLANKDASTPSDLGTASRVVPKDHVHEGDGNGATFDKDNAIVALLKKHSMYRTDQKPSTGVRPPFKEGSRVQKLYSGLGGGLAIEEFLRQLCCPITQDIMQDAVIASDGVSYERSAIEDRLQQSTDPMLSLLSRQLLPNRTLKDIIEHAMV